MRRALLPLLAAALLAGCSLGASVSDEPAKILPLGFTGEGTMFACPYTREACTRVTVVGDGVTVERMRNKDGEWIGFAEATCRDGYCHVVDETGAEWKLEP